MGIKAQWTIVVRASPSWDGDHGRLVHDSPVVGRGIMDALFGSENGGLHSFFFIHIVMLKEQGGSGGIYPPDELR